MIMARHAAPPYKVGAAPVLKTEKPDGMPQEIAQATWHSPGDVR